MTWPVRSPLRMTFCKTSCNIQQPISRKHPTAVIKYNVLIEVRDVIIQTLADCN